ncbi:CRISPR-associated endoribonuclease Cas6 [Streptomyces sp. SL13]|uniref:CRISPR-associated endoribonuclease Cas6 n=1 Tax=Streptantibioticus silvisoli TaxID=2705255 RepID=A0AA90KIV1_9ACTN|nr:CRISPR-associated endoribonuclease Cas6 [Streptantibioticus silvisoli]MDI5973725.1 CRISPR-associated endoribonuclease Cas6 [Streptantibioticus silvisoli]
MPLANVLTCEFIGLQTLKEVWAVRLRVDFHTGARQLPWDSVLAPGRALAYGLLERGAPELGARLHTKGWGPHGMVPFGHGAPVFPAARSRRGVYAADGPGIVELGSPLLAVVEGWAKALAGMPVLAWGETAFIVDRVEPVEAPEFPSGRAVFRTVTPVVTKAVLERDASGARVPGSVWRLPGEPEWDVYVQNNLRRKAESLGLDPGVTLESVRWVGRKRSFAVASASGGGGKKPGACVEVTVSGPPETLSAIADWGLGQANAAGMGWIGA